jgi:uncharacterized protein
MEDLTEKVKEHVRQKLSGEATGHDYFHTERVFKLARRIAEERHAYMETFVKKFLQEWQGE